MKREPSKEAKLGEVMREVSIADLGEILKNLALGVGCLGVITVISTFGANAFESFNTGFHVPTVVVIAFIVLMFVINLTTTKSFHDWHLQLYFPKLGFVGVVFITVYVTGVIQVFRIMGRLPAAEKAWLGVIPFLAMFPGMMFLGLCEIGHKRLMEKRWAELEEVDQPRSGREMM